MAGSMAALFVTVACLNDPEWEATAPVLGMSSDEREGMQCLMGALGGPGEMAAAMRAAQEGDFDDLARAGTECGLEMGPLPGQPPGTPHAGVHARHNRATQSRTPAITGETPPRTPSTPTP